MISDQIWSVFSVRYTVRIVILECEHTWIQVFLSGAWLLSLHGKQRVAQQWLTPN